MKMEKLLFAKFCIPLAFKKFKICCELKISTAQAKMVRIHAAFIFIN